MDPNISRKMDQPSYAIRDAWEDVEHRELIKQTLGDLEEEDIEFLEDLQRWHDDVLVSGHQAFVSDLEVIADEWGLQWPGAKA